MDAAKLIRYTHAARQRYLKLFRDMPWDELIMDRGASFPSIRDIFMHALDMEDMMINKVIPGKLEQRAPYNYGMFTDLNSIEKHVKEVEEKVDAYLAGLTAKELDRKAQLPWRRDPPVILRVEDILVQVAIEATSHMGELIAILWQVDKQPPFLNWSTFIEQAT